MVAFVRRDRDFENRDAAPRGACLAEESKRDAVLTEPPGRAFVDVGELGECRGARPDVPAVRGEHSHDESEADDFRHVNFPPVDLRWRFPFPGDVIAPTPETRRATHISLRHSASSAEFTAR